MEPIESVLKNIYQSNAYRNDLSWAYFDDEPRVHFYSLPNNSK